MISAGYEMVDLAEQHMRRNDRAARLASLAHGWISISGVSSPLKLAECAIRSLQLSVGESHPDTKKAIILSSKLKEFSEFRKWLRDKVIAGRR